MRRIVFGVLILLIGSSCGSGEIPVEPGAVDGRDLPDLGFSDAGDDSATAVYRELLSATCFKAFECCAPSTARALSGVFDSSECRTRPLQGFASITVQGLEEALLAGTVSLDPAAATLCREELDAVSCSEWTRTDVTRLEVGGCREAIEPMLDSGSQCTADFECRSGRCMGHSDGVTRCAEVREDGDSCDPDEGQTCRPGSHCDNFDAFRCVPLLDDGTTCVTDLECASGRCETGPRGGYVCTSRSGVCEGAPVE